MTVVRAAVAHRDTKTERLIAVSKDWEGFWSTLLPASDKVVCLGAAIDDISAGAAIDLSCK